MAASTTMAVLTQHTDQELRLLGIEPTIKLLRQSQSLHNQCLLEHGALMMKVNHTLQDHLGEVSRLKKHNKHLLRQHEVSLEDNRLAGIELKDWQEFARYCSRVLHTDVANFKEKLAVLQSQIVNLLEDNEALNQLCSEAAFLLNQKYDLDNRLANESSIEIRPLNCEGESSSDNFTNSLEEMAKHNRVSVTSTELESAIEVMGIREKIIHQDWQPLQRNIIRSLCNMAWQKIDVKNSNEDALHK